MCLKCGLNPMSNFGIFFIFWVSTENVANKPMFKTLPFRRRRSDQKSNAGFLFVCVWRCSVKSFVSIAQECVGGVAKIQFCGFRDFAKKNYGRKWAWPMPKDATDSSEAVCTRFWMWEVRCGSYSPKRVFLGIAPPSVRRVWILSSAYTSQTWI